MHRRPPSQRPAGSTVRRAPSRSSLLVGLVVVLLAIVPVLVPLLVIRGTGATVAPPPGLAAAPGVPGSRPPDSPAATRSAPLPGAGSLASPAPSPATSVPPPARPTTDAPAAPPPPSPPPSPPLSPPLSADATNTAPTTDPPTTDPPTTDPPTTHPPTTDPPTTHPPTTDPPTTDPPTTDPPTTDPPTTDPPTTAPPTALVAAPDLVVVSLSWSPEQPAAGEAVTFTAVVRNAGIAPTPEVTHGVSFDVDGTQVSWSSGSSAPLAPGEERTYTADGGPAGSTWTAVGGEHWLQAYVDDVGRIGETDDANNVLATTLTVP